MPGFPFQPRQTCDALNAPCTIPPAPLPPLIYLYQSPSPSRDQGGDVRAATARLSPCPQEPSQCLQRLRASSACRLQLPVSPQTSPGGPARRADIPQPGDARSAGFLPDFQALALLQLTGKERTRGTFSGSPGVQATHQGNN